MAKSGVSAGSALRVLCVLLVLAAFIGGAAVGTYFAVRNRSEAVKDSKEIEGENVGAVPEGTKRLNRFYAMSYSPFGLGNNQLCEPYTEIGEQCLLPDQVTEDIRQIATWTNRVKLYSLECFETTQLILDYAVEVGMTVMLGVWVNDVDRLNRAELNRFRLIAEDYADKGVITDILVGNEAIFIQEASMKQVVGMLESVRDIAKETGLTARIGTAEIYNMWVGEQIRGGSRQIPEDTDLLDVVKVSDFIGLNAHPYYNSIDPLEQDAAQDMLSSVESVEEYWKDRGYDIPVFLTETGFPTEGPNSNPAGSTPSVKGLIKFASDIEDVSRSENLPVYFFEPYDGDWKRRWNKNNDEVDYHFGLATCKRRLKMKESELPSEGAL